MDGSLKEKQSYKNNISKEIYVITYDWKEVDNLISEYKYRYLNINEIQNSANFDLKPKKLTVIYTEI